MDRDDKLGSLGCLALVLMAGGAAIAWGFGGMLFAAGLWLMLVTMTEYMGEH